MILMKVLNNKAKHIDIYFHFFCLKKQKQNIFVCTVERDLPETC